MTGEDRFPLGPFQDQSYPTLDEYIDELYQLFLSDLVYHPLPWENEGMRVSLRKHPMIDGTPRHFLAHHLRRFRIRKLAQD